MYVQDIIMYVHDTIMYVHDNIFYFFGTNTLPYICNISEIMKFVLFADDTNILCKHENYVYLCELVNIEMSKLSKWFSINKLSLNVKKTSYMLFGNRHVNNDIKIRIDMEEIEKVHVTKF